MSSFCSTVGLESSIDTLHGLNALIFKHAVFFFSRYFVVIVDKINAKPWSSPERRKWFYLLIKQTSTKESYDCNFSGRFLAFSPSDKLHRSGAIVCEAPTERSRSPTSGLKQFLMNNDHSRVSLRKNFSSKRETWTEIWSSPKTEWTVRSCQRVAWRGPNPWRCDWRMVLPSWVDYS